MRPSRRAPDQLRPVTLERGVVKYAEGSCMAGREAAICRELTKLHEEITRAPVTELAKGAGSLETRGEFVLVIGPPAAGAKVMAENELDDVLRSSLKRDSVKDAVAHA